MSRRSHLKAVTPDNFRKDTLYWKIDTLVFTVVNTSATFDNVAVDWNNDISDSNGANVPASPAKRRKQATFKIIESSFNMTMHE
ncbi:hypothetical protein HI914_03664 [Erysiphe necator]|nr:hypothetical protein HI914_03664 [Erysiphe necator]